VRSGGPVSGSGPATGKGAVTVPEEPPGLSRLSNADLGKSRFHLLGIDPEPRETLIRARCKGIVIDANQRELVLTVDNSLVLQGEGNLDLQRPTTVRVTSQVQIDADALRAGILSFHAAVHSP